ncbi:hypothetical protein FV139_05260 [Parahaliea maris]|uniref:Uncharacterized protein n=1 Tax=Parahaliea maris TaxID=2716870 RepID=A0A5C9A3G4_9GAMM|nr:hypothetical protein [Parahaliea maris]TXS95308.1 hypothetical protein FV139_05260 [Parahaliea maris]
MTFRQLLGAQLRHTGLFMLTLGLVLTALLLVVGGVEGSISLDIDISRTDGPWLVLGLPLLFTLLALLCSPFAFLLYRGGSRLWTRLVGR